MHNDVLNAEIPFCSIRVVIITIAYNKLCHSGMLRDTSWKRGIAHAIEITFEARICLVNVELNHHSTRYACEELSCANRRSRRAVIMCSLSNKVERCVVSIAIIMTIFFFKPSAHCRCAIYSLKWLSINVSALSVTK
jgi:hypothetical protein